jgi:thiol:disulfide interchange protein DsbC
MNTPRLLALLVVSALAGSLAATAPAQTSQTVPPRPAAKPAAKPAAAAPKPAGQGTRLATAPDPRAGLSRRMPGSKPEDFRPTSIPGLYEYARGADILYLSADGRFAIDGDLYDLDSEQNVSERRRREARLALLGKVPESNMLVFGPRNARHTVTVFTDIDCGFCRKLHSEMAQYNALGIRVRYLFYPRSGPDTESWAKAAAVWCAPNRNDAMTRAKNGEAVRSPKCDASAVARDYELGDEFAVQGTPAIVMPSGEMLPGYLPPPMLLKRLEPAAPAAPGTPARPAGR